ncbi:MAG: hypothetical protein ABSE20_01250 [Acetobacteraceae bacterium]|jgi:hypothetical protein
MHDPLRERNLTGNRKPGSRRVAMSMLHRTSGSGGDVQQTAGAIPHAVVLRFQPQTTGPHIGHNGGPLLPPDDPAEGWRQYCWRRAHKAAWKTPPREIALRRLERAEALGMTYHGYTLEIMERGRYL